MNYKGRPNKYDAIIGLLDSEYVYSAASIAQFAARSGMLDGVNLKHMHKRVRISLARMAQNKPNLFPVGGDGMVMKRGRSPMPGWFGWRWKNAGCVQITYPFEFMDVH